ncbi:hypothetical protein SH668x_000640 [Planctomicrobium sp. SH668]|uniref:hypothetical protein n=1 Tax=Planctomicrobium sp. SH668 TaxID=3448126 RepID=UPI003F5B3A13
MLERRLAGDRLSDPLNVLASQSSQNRIQSGSGESPVGDSGILSKATISKEDTNIVQPSHRVILIGASNITINFPLIVQTICRSIPAPVEIFAAHGHGRSFCKWNYVINRGLPSILNCQLWSDVAERPPVEHRWGLVTDVGNDLIYGTDVPTVLNRVTTAFVRLQFLGYPITYVRPPVERVLKLSERQYRVTKKILFPGQTVPWELMQQRLLEVDAKMLAIAEQFQAKVVTPRREWYGIDPIHIRHRQRLKAWKEILSAWAFDEEVDLDYVSYSFAMKTWLSPPAERTYGKRRYLNSQPSWKMPDGNSLWQY